MTKRGLLLWVLTIALLTSAVPSWAAPANTPPTGPKAGTITALLPVADITRGAGKKAVTTAAKKGDVLVWNDLIKTEKGGRARITLTDQSILSLGSQAQLRIVKHDAKSQQTTLEMAYGRVRAEVATITRDGGSFELRTPTAVAGVIGTDFGLDSSSVGGDTFVCLAGAVQVGNSNPNVHGSVQCTAGQTTTVQPGKPPSPPKPATLQQLQQVLSDTDPSIIASISPAATLPGSTITTTIAGQNLATVNAVSISGTGITATLKSASASGVQVQLVIAQNATPGPRSITLSKPQGASSAGIFTVLGPSSGNAQTADLQTLQELTQTAETGLGGFLSGAQQTADEVAQQVTNANLNLPKPIDLTAFATALNQEYGTVQTASQTQDAAIAAAALSATNEFNTSYNTAYQALLTRNSSGTPDTTFTNAVAAAFQTAQTSIQTAVTTAQGTLNTTVQAYATAVDQLQQTWIQNINAAEGAELGGPTPKVNALDLTIDVGGTASFDASGSAGNQGASIASTTWTLCAPSYQPAGFGTPLPAGTPACNAVSGFASTQSEFDIASCSLNPGTYYARLLLTDSNGKTTPMDVRLTILQPSYGTPSQTLRSLASAYGSLQYGPFSAFFDPNAPGIATYLNNVQTTLLTLNSMNINLVSSQDTVNCNDAVTRAAWQQNYSFKGSPNSVLTANEQLSIYMHRTPGTGWLVTNLVGDNGTVQGTLPGPLVTNAALPDLVVTGAGFGSTAFSLTIASPVNPGMHAITAVIGNVGNADLITNVPVAFTILDASNNPIASTTVNPPVPITQASSVNVTANLTFPMGADGTKLTLLVNVNPGCSLPEKVCDGKNQQAYPLVIQNNIITFANVTSSLTLSPGGSPGTISMDVTSSYYPVQVCSSVSTDITISGSRGGIKPAVTGNPTCKSLTAAGTLQFSLAAALTAAAGTESIVFTGTNAGNPSQNVPPATATVTVPVTVAIPDLQFGTISFPAALQMGASGPTTIPVMNTGNGPAAAGWNLVVTINGTQAATAIGPAIPAGQTVNVPVTLAVPVVGTPPQALASVAVVLTLNSNNAILESNTGNNTASATVTLYDFALTTLPTGTQTGVVGRAFSLTAVSVLPSGYPLPLAINYTGVPAGLTGTNSVIAGTPTAAGSSTVTISGTADGVTHAASGSVAMNIVSEITPVESTVPSLVAGGAAQNLTLSVTGGVYPVTVSVTLPTGITTTAGTIVGNVSTQTLTGPGNVTWDLTAGFTATTGGSLTVPVHATDAGFAGTSTPAGNVTFNASYAVNANADFVITGVVFAGHTAPYTGANGLQVGESTQIQVTVANNGNGSPTGTVTVTTSCGNPSYCSTPGTATVAAPAAGSSVVASIPITNNNLPVASYTGTATLTTNISGADVGSTFMLPFDEVDFAFSANTMEPSQNLPIGGSGMISLSLAVQVPEGSPFGIPITPVASSNLTFVPATQTTAGASIPFTVDVASGTTPSSSTPDMITVNATNHGVTKTASVPVNYYTAQLVPQNLFVNDAANPLEVPVATSAGAPNNYPNLNLKMTGNYIGGTASLSVTNPTCGGFSDVPFPISVQPTDLLNFPIYAATGNTCPPTGSQVTIQAAIPNTSPATTQTVYTLYVAPKGLAQLQVMSATPSRDFTSQPWLAGEPIDWTVVVKNVGSGPSAGNEVVQVSLNGAQVGQGTLTASIAANATGTAIVHTDAPDVPADASFGPTANLTVHIVLDSQGDLAPGSGDFFTSVNVSNWSIGVNGAGSSDSSPLTLTVGSTTSGTANVVVSALSGGTFNPNLSLPLVLGSYSTGQLNPSAISPTTVSSSAGSTVTVSIQTGQSPASGYYFAQVIAQMKDGANVITQRQATVHVNISNSNANNPATINLASTANNIASCGSGGDCGTPSAAAQINGPLPTAFSLTATVSFCSGGPCTGNVDVSFTDTYLTVTTPQISTIGVTSPGNTLAVRVEAADNPDGSINTGSASVTTSVSAIQAQWVSGARQPTPDPVGNNQFTMAFNIGDIYVSTSSCVGIVPQSTSATPLTMSWNAVSGFNVPSLSWEWEDSNHIPVGASPLSFSVSTGSSTYSSGSYSSLPTFNLNNVSTTGVDGLQTYYFAVTVTNGLATATKYFPVQFDLSQSQTFCPVITGSRGSIGSGQTIRGFWGRNGLIGSARGGLKSGKPDLRISASDISFTPSMPRNGDTVNVRFRVNNMGDVSVTNVPIALQINGTTVVSDTFDFPVGKYTLGALQWSNAKIPTSRPVSPGAMIRPARPSPGNPPAATGLVGLNAMIVIDPKQTIQEKTNIAKSAALGHFNMNNGTVTAASSGAGLQRAMLEIAEGGCAGLRFQGGAGGCGGADVTVSVEDLAKGVYRLEAANGIADLGMGNARFMSAGSNASFGSQALAQTGHTYAVQLRGGNVALFTLSSVRNPGQVSAATSQVFRGPAAKVVNKLGHSTAAPEPQTATDPKVYFNIMYQGQ